MGDKASTPRPTALSLAEALDVFEVHLRAAAGRRIYQVGGPLNVALLTQRPDSRAGFATAMSALSDVFDRFNPTSGAIKELGADVTAMGAWPRVQVVLEARADAAGAEVSLQAAILVLSAVQALRHGLQHAGAKPLEAAHRVGVRPWPPNDWGDAWDQVVTVVVGALNQLRDACRAILDAADR